MRYYTKNQVALIAVGRYSSIRERPFGEVLETLTHYWLDYLGWVESGRRTLVEAVWQ